MKIFLLKKQFLISTLIIFLLIILFLYFLFFKSYRNIIPVNINDDISLNDITKSNKKIAYLTFDDGPTTTATSKVLDILKSENIKATFFVLGKHVKENPDLVKRAYQEGHYIANHGYSHNNEILYKNMESFKNEILSTDIEISKALGIENYSSHIFRFPNGYMANMYLNQKKKALNILKELNYLYVDWNCLNKDSEKKYSNYELLNNLKKSIKNKGTLIILMHDTTDVNKSYEVLKDSIDYLKSQGYTFSNFYDFISRTNREAL